jgi:cellulose synthase/poly-beta-1,6-N-acetylglucosamine synthase-like glycosyltransferase
MEDRRSAPVAPPKGTGTESETGVPGSTYLFSLLALVSVSAVTLLIDAPEIYLAAACAFAGDLYLLWLAGRPKADPAEGVSRGLGPLLLVGIVPAAVTTFLAARGGLGPLPESVYRILLATGFSVALLVSTFPIPLAVKFKSMTSGLTSDHTSTPYVSILVPAYNEQAVIARTLESLVNLNYDKKEIIVIDDGSADLTPSIASWYKKYGIKVLRKPNGGKASALNYGILFSKGEFLIMIDSDSMVKRGAVKEIVGPLAGDPDVVAVAGNIKVLNSRSFLTRIQELEYAMAINTVRRAFSLFGTVMIVPGAFGAFRKREVVGVGGYDKDTMTEDFDLTVKLLKTRGTVTSTATGVAYTEVPSTWKSLYAQRLRWNTGTFQTVYKHRDVFLNRRYRLLHTFVFPMVLLSLFNPVASFIAITGGIMLVLTGAPLLLAEMLALFILIQFFVALVALSLDGGDYRLAVYSPFFVVVYKQFIDFVTIVSAFKATVARKQEWGKLAREGGTEAIRVPARNRVSSGGFE